MLAFFVFVFFLLTTPLTNAENGTFHHNRSSSSSPSPIEQLLIRQYDHRLMANTTTTNRMTLIRSMKKSSSIEALKRLIANRQRSSTSTRILTQKTSTTTTGSSRSRTTAQITSASTSSPIPTSTSFVVRVKSKVETIFVHLSTMTVVREETSTDVQYSPITSASTLPTSDSGSKATILVIILVCSFSGFLFFALLLAFLLRRRINIAYLKLPCIHSSSSSTGKESHDDTPLSYSPIHAKFIVPEEFSVDQLYDIYMQKHALDDLAFAIEFKTIPNCEELPCTAASRPMVASKNRFLNILPIDATRVILNLLNNDPSTDYINGNYISGYKCPNKFIATQGPKSDTCEDLWRMMWELKLKSIVMLTNVIEGVSRMAKCHQYWPDLGCTIIYGSYRVTCIDTISVGDYDKRYFQLIKISNNEDISPPSSPSIVPVDDALSSISNNEQQQQPRLIIQYHYTQWKDMDVPNDSHALLHLIREVNEQTNPTEYPIVVHCTAGVGRTGTYITIDAMLDKIEQEGKIDVYNFVVQMRRERSLMVQTVRQYVFIYRSLLEYYLYGETRIEANMFRSTYSNLKKNKQILLIAEYNKLSLLPVENVSQRDAHTPGNAERNRHSQMVPYDRNRVCLSRILGHPYINASFIEGYSRECSFIITQDPLSDTIHEFWRMFIEHDSNCIVQLHSIADSSPSCPSYYPDDDDTTMKVGTTTLLKLVHKELIQEKMIIRELCLTDTREALSKTLFHFEYLLPISTNDEYQTNQCLPTVLTHTLFDFIGHINKRQHMTMNNNRYITVHCGNGGPSCSIFCMCVILLDQLKNEHAVDIFQGVRNLQRQRSGMITSLAQYDYLYGMILKFLEESFDLAASKSSPSLNNSVYDNNLIDADDDHDRL